ncbi:MAG: zinc finger domain-containing protein [Candidatus Aenigmatarchaeota archaeon]
MEMKCVSCGIKIENQRNWVEFLCPNCGKIKIIRCEKCRALGNEYLCSSCSFKGP